MVKLRNARTRAAGSEQKRSYVLFGHQRQGHHSRSAGCFQQAEGAAGPGQSVTQLEGDTLPCNVKGAGVKTEHICLHGPCEGKDGQQRLDSFWRPASGSVMDVLALMEILIQLQVLLPMDMVLTRLRPSRPMAHGSGLSPPSRGAEISHVAGNEERRGQQNIRVCAAARPSS